jgi:hypothetical protein
MPARGGVSFSALMSWSWLTGAFPTGVIFTVMPRQGAGPSFLRAAASGRRGWLSCSQDFGAISSLPPAAGSKGLGRGIAISPKPPHSRLKPKAWASSPMLKPSGTAHLHACQQSQLGYAVQARYKVSSTKQLWVRASTPSLRTLGPAQLSHL